MADMKNSPHISVAATQKSSYTITQIPVTCCTKGGHHFSKCWHMDGWVKIKGWVEWLSGARESGVGVGIDVALYCSPNDSFNKALHSWAVISHQVWSWATQVTAVGPALPGCRHFCGDESRTFSHSHQRRFIPCRYSRVVMIHSYLYYW